MNKKDFNKKIITYANRLLKYEYDKYLEGQICDYFHVEEAHGRLLDFLKSGDSLRLENKELRNRIRDLEDELYGRS